MGFPLPTLAAVDLSTFPITEFKPREIDGVIGGVLEVRLEVRHQGPSDIGPRKFVAATILEVVS